MEERGICVLCGKEYDNYGNNPEPLAHEGRCCSECNERVIDARVKRMQARVAESGTEKKSAEKDTITLDVAAATRIGFASYMALSGTLLQDSYLRRIFEASLSHARSTITKLAKAKGLDEGPLSQSIDQTALCVAVTTLQIMMMTGEKYGAVEDMRALIYADEESDDE